MLKFIIYVLVFYMIYRWISGSNRGNNIYVFNNYNNKPQEPKTGKVEITQKKEDGGGFTDYEEIK